MQFFVQTPVRSKLESLIVSLILAMKTPAPRSASVSPVDAVVARTPVSKTYEGKADLNEYNCSGIFNVYYLIHVFDVSNNQSATETKIRRFISAKFCRRISRCVYIYSEN